MAALGEPAPALLVGPADAAEAEEKQVLRSSTDDQTSQEPRAIETADPPAATTPGDFKEGGYGWVVVLAVFLLNAHTWGMNSSYAVFLAYYLNHNVFPGSSAIAYAFVGGLSISCSLLMSPLATMSIGRFGTRVTLLIGIFFETVAFVGASFTKKMWHLLLTQGIAFGIGMGFIFVGSVGLVPQWFVKRRSFANALGAGGSGFGGLIYSLATNAMIRNIGLPWAFRVLAILAFAVNFLSTILVRDRNKAVGSVHVPFELALLRRPAYLLFACWAFFSILGYVIVVFSISSYAQAVGLSASQGSIASALFNLSQGFGRPLIGLVSDPFGRLNVMALGTLAAAVAALFVWIFAAKFYAGLIVYSLLGGFAGILWATVAPVAAEVVGVPHLPAALSMLWLVLVPPATCAEAIGLALRTSDGDDSYLHVQLFAGFCYVAAFLCGWLLRGCKLHQLDDIEDQANGRPRTRLWSYLWTGKWVFRVQRL